MITLAALKKTLKGMKTPKTARIVTNTAPSLRGGQSNPYVHWSASGELRKVTEQTVILYPEVDSLKYQQQVREVTGDKSFVVSPRPWGERIPGLPIVKHRGKHLLECTIVSNDDETFILLGKKIPREKIEGLPTQEDPKAKVLIRCFSLESLVSLELI